MNLLYINKYLYPKGGAETSLFTTANALVQRGHSVSYFGMLHEANTVPAVGGVPHLDLGDCGGVINKIRFAGRTLYYMEAQRRIERLLAENRYDLVHLNNIAHQLSPSIIAGIKRMGVPIVMSVRDYKLVCPNYLRMAHGRVCERCSGGRYLNAIAQRCHKNDLLASSIVAAEAYLHKWMRLYEKVDMFVATSEFVRDVLLRMGLKGDIEVVPNALEMYEPVRRDTSRDKTRPIVAYFGRIEAEKGVGTLISAMKNIEADLWVIGDGSKFDEVKNRAEREGTCAKFFGYLNTQELRTALENCSFVVVPSEWEEPFGRTVIEAFQLGKPVIVAQMGGLVETVKEGVTGFSFRAGDVLELREKIRLLCSDDKLRATMSLNAIEAARHYGVDSHGFAMEQLYSKVVARFAQ